MHKGFLWVGLIMDLISKGAPLRLSLAALADILGRCTAACCNACGSELCLRSNSIS